jgi:hypothetical protein
LKPENWDESTKFAAAKKEENPPGTGRTAGRGHELPETVLKEMI